MRDLKNVIYGAIIGMANVIPGVSGGTMAVMLDVYDKILMALSLKNAKENARFLATLGIGCLIGIFAFSKVITYLYENYHMILNFCFIGLVLGSIPMIYRKAKFDGVVAKNWIPFIITFMFMIMVAIIGSMGDSGPENVAVGIENLSTAPFFAWLFISAFISTIAMILPGISGSFMLLLFGCYTLIMKAISEFQFGILFVTGLGVLAGGFVGVKFVKIMLRKHPQALYFAILGLVIGSIFTIYPGFTFNTDGIVALIGMTICAGISYGFDKVSR